MEKSISMPGIVFMKFASVSKNGVLSIFVTYEAKYYEASNAGVYNPITKKMHFVESNNRGDCDKIHQGHWVEVRNSDFTKKMDAIAPMWLQTGFPIVNKKLIRFVTNKDDVKKKGAAPLYAVKSCGLSDPEQAQIMENFNKKYPKYLDGILKRYEARVAKGKYRSLAQLFEDSKNGGKHLTQNFTEDIFGRSPFEDTEPEAKKYPFTKRQVNRATKRQVQDWCEDVDIDYSNFKTLKEAKAYLNGMEGMK
jgi:hypothetical protein